MDYDTRQTYLRYCPICAKENIRKPTHSHIYVAGMIDYYLTDEYADTVCDKHPDQSLIKMAMTCEEFDILREFVNDPQFFISMNELKANDIIEYNLKMAQFKQQAQQGSIQTQSTSTVSSPKCPYCNSTNVKKITMTSKVTHGAIFGLFGARKILKQWHCNNCKSDF